MRPQSTGTWTGLLIMPPLVGLCLCHTQQRARCQQVAHGATHFSQPNAKKAKSRAAPHRRPNAKRSAALPRVARFRDSAAAALQFYRFTRALAKSNLFFYRWNFYELSLVLLPTSSDGSV